ncbi:MAG: hypothetical protein OXT67_10150 [Zetaproteobacteria bacterium]|nr:hypothetical protein [Zetaproteobacteria bacterium]
MFEFVLNQLMIFGLPVCGLGVLYLIDWKLFPLIGGRHLDLLTFVVFFTISMIAIVGVPTFPPLDTTRALIFITPGCMVSVLLSDLRARLGFDLLLLNVGLYYVFHPLLEDGGLTIVAHWLGGNLVAMGLWVMLLLLKAALLRMVLPFVLLAMGGFAFVAGSLSIGQVLIVTSIPLSSQMVYCLVTRRELSPLRYAYFVAVLPVVMAFEYFHYVY